MDMSGKVKQDSTIQYLCMRAVYHCAEKQELHSLHLITLQI
jgi:hypothetical protein